MERLIVWIIQIYVLQLPPMLQWVFGSEFGLLAVGHGEGVCGNYWVVESLNIKEICERNKTICFCVVTSADW